MWMTVVINNFSGFLIPRLMVRLSAVGWTTIWTSANKTFHSSVLKILERISRKSANENMDGFLFPSPFAMHVFSCCGSQFFGAARECLFQKKKVQQDDVIKRTQSSLTQRERSAKNAEDIWWFCLRQLQSNRHFISFQWTFVVTFCQVWFDRLLSCSFYW